MCTGERGESEYGKLHYVGTVFHRIVPGLVAQAGDIQFRDDALLRGAGGGSIYGRFFDNEKQLDVHDRRGIVGMAHDGPNTNGSQFYITFAEAGPAAPSLQEVRYVIHTITFFCSFVSGKFSYFRKKIGKFSNFFFPF